MADLDFITDLSNGFQISLTDNPQKVTGNRAMLNHFEITFMTQSKVYILPDIDANFVDTYGGGADVLISKPQVLNDPGGIVSAITVAVEKTVSSILQDQPETLPDNEKLDSATLLNMYIEDETVYARIQVIPVVTDDYETLISNLPVIKRT